jgi:hypothetical protein
MVGSVLDRFKDAGDFAVSVSQRLMCCIALGCGVTGEAAEFGVEFVDERGNEFRL